jgi:hypothetical protein
MQVNASKVISPITKHVFIIERFSIFSSSLHQIEQFLAKYVPNFKP